MAAQPRAKRAKRVLGQPRVRQPPTICAPNFKALHANKPAQTGLTTVTPSCSFSSPYQFPGLVACPADTRGDHAMIGVSHKHR